MRTLSKAILCLIAALAAIGPAAHWQEVLAHLRSWGMFPNSVEERLPTSVIPLGLDSSPAHVVARCFNHVPLDWVKKALKLEADKPRGSIKP